MLGRDLKAFWKRLPYGENNHPDDQAILQSRRHNLQTEVVPGPWYFNMFGARLYILMANPGRISGRDLADFYCRDGELDKLWRRKLAGEEVEAEMLQANAENRLAGHAWYMQRLRGIIDSHDAILRDVCVLNLVAYRSSGVGDYAGVVRYLPSTEIVKAVVHDEILPRARAGDVMLVCARNVENWGLRARRRRRPSRSVALTGVVTSRSIRSMVRPYARF